MKTSWKTRNVCWERLKGNFLFRTIKRSNTSVNTIKIFVHNAQSLSKHIDDIVSDVRIKNNGIIGFKKTQIKPSDFTCLRKTMTFFNINFSNNESKFLILAYRCRNNVAI